MLTGVNFLSISCLSSRNDLREIHIVVLIKDCYDQDKYITD